MTESLDDTALDRLFRTARTRNGWTDRPVAEALLRQVYDLAKMGPTSANVSPARFVFVASAAAKARLAPHLSNTNRPKALAAPVCAIVAFDLDFAQRIPELFPNNPGAQAWFADPKVAEVTAFRNGSLQGAYLMLAARALGLDCGPMSGFSQSGLDAEFFAGTSWRSNFLCSLGYGSDENLFPRNPRLAFEDACRVL
ncbi:malonic semialdehyde reductase [Phenylobacterium sp.]|uniref:malonic semialdehyde reductase n=1 Tax=Phenylobacterium sp. TaxID=1871053 RepID=UPI0039838501